MPLQLEIISEHRDLVAGDAVREFDESGGTIGRSLESDWILPDPDRYISGRHATIDYKGGIYYLADVSTNGVYVNGENEPIGRGNPRRLFNGDHLRMGDFEFVVAIDRGESIAMPIEGDQTELPDPIESRVPEFADQTGIPLLDEEELAYKEDFLSDLLESDASPPLAVARKATPAPAPAPVHEREAPDDDYQDDERRDAGTDDIGITADDLFDTFLDGLGLSRADLHPDVDPADVLQNAGHVLKELVEGMNRMLVSRRNLKSAFRLDQTTILPRHNNPLKLSENARDSLRQLLVGHEGEYLGPRDAAREVCRDLVRHQDALLDAMHAAFGEFADRFDPEELVAAFRREQPSRPLLGFLERQKYWQMYCDLYPVLTEKGESRFPQLFAEEFVRTYERQIADYKRLEAAPVLQTTVRLDRRPTEAPVRAVAAVYAAADTPLADDVPTQDDVPSIEFDDTFAELFDDELAS